MSDRHEKLLRRLGGLRKPASPPSEMVVYDLAEPLQMIHPRPTAELLVHWEKIFSAKDGAILLEEPYIVDVATAERITGQIPEDVSVALVIIRAPRSPD